MKEKGNVYFVLLLATLLIGLLTACSKQQEKDTEQSNKNETAKTDNTETVQSEKNASGEIQWAARDIAAVAFVGYYTYAEDFRNSPELDRLSEKYDFNKNDVPIVENEGDEIYLVIPRFSEAMISVNSFPEEKLIDPESTAECEILYKFADGDMNTPAKPFFVKCKSDGGLVNTEICIVDSGPCGIEYCPQLDQQDGSLIVPADFSESARSIQDITEPIPQSSLAQEVDRPQDNFEAFICRNGQVIFCVKEAVGALGDEAYPVQGINGRCVGLFTGDIGQDTNPFLCMLMDDGGVCILNYNSVQGLDPLVPGHCLASGRLSDLENIVSFKQSAVTDAGSSYTTIFAVDKGGTEHEIKPCIEPFFPLYFFKNDDDGIAAHEIIIGDDWTIEYLSGRRDEYSSVWNEQYLGRLHPLKIDYDNDVYEYEYEMVEHNRYTHEGIVRLNEKPVKGSLRLTVTGRGHNISVLSGPIKFGTNGTDGVYYGDSMEPQG